MCNKIYQFFCLLSLYTIGCYSCTQETTNDQSNFLKSLVEVVDENHLAPKEMNDRLSVTRLKLPNIFPILI